MSVNLSVPTGKNSSASVDRSTLYTRTGYSVPGMSHAIMTTRVAVLAQRDTNSPQPIYTYSPHGRDTPSLHTAYQSPNIRSTVCTLGLHAMCIYV